MIVPFPLSLAPLTLRVVKATDFGRVTVAVTLALSVLVKVDISPSNPTVAGLDASKLAPFGYFEIVPNMIIGYFFFNNFPDHFHFIGLSIIISSGIYIFRREMINKSS